MLSPENKAILKSKVERKLKRLEEDIVFLLDATKPIAPENAIGRVSRMDAINNKSVSEQALRQAKEQKIRLLEMLENIDREDFGVCSQCQEDIPLPRLVAMPESDRCVKCSARAI